MIGRRDARCLLLYAAALAFFFSPLLLGRIYYWGDLTYLHFPWKTFAAQCLQEGRFPHWEPYTYLGMPFHAAFQAGVLYPLSLPFDLFPFEAALSLYLPLHFFLGGAFAFLGLRALGARRQGALLAATAFAMGGVWAAHLPFLNHLAALCWLPAFLFLPQPWLFGLALAVSFLGGYPTMTLGAALAATLLRLAWEKPEGRRLAGGWALGLALAAPLLLPAWPLAASSERAAGLPASVVTQYSFGLRDWPQLLSPLLLPKARFSPSGLWWLTSYGGLVPMAAAALGAWKLRRRARIFAYAAAALFLCLGSTFAPSAWVWTHLPGLSLIRYPGNMLYLLLPALMLWTAAARFPGALWLLAAAELAFVGAGAQPSVRRPYFAEKGPLVSVLQDELGAHRYLMTPRALFLDKGEGPDEESAARDFKGRLYGIDNLPYRLASVGGFGEPLVPKGSYDWMDFLFRRKGLAEVEPYAALLDVSRVLSPEPFEDAVIRPAGRALWAVGRLPEASRALLFGEELPEQPPWLGAKAPGSGAPLLYRQDREDGFSVSGTGPGWVYVSNPGTRWRAWSGGRPLALRPALGPFLQARAPAGPFRIVLRYDPPLWALGLALGLGAALLLTWRAASVIN